MVYSYSTFSKTPGPAHDWSEALALQDQVSSFFHTQSMCIRWQQKEKARRGWRERMTSQSVEGVSLLVKDTQLMKVFHWALYGHEAWHTVTLATDSINTPSLLTQVMVSRFRLHLSPAGHWVLLCTRVAVCMCVWPRWHVIWNRKGFIVVGNTDNGNRDAKGRPPCGAHEKRWVTARCMSRISFSAGFIWDPAPTHL